MKKSFFTLIASIIALSMVAGALLPARAAVAAAPAETGLINDAGVINDESGMAGGESLDQETGGQGMVDPETGLMSEENPQGEESSQAEEGLPTEESSQEDVEMPAGMPEPGPEEQADDGSQAVREENLVESDAQGIVTNGKKDAAAADSEEEPAETPAGITILNSQITCSVDAGKITVTAGPDGDYSYAIGGLTFKVLNERIATVSKSTDDSCVIKLIKPGTTKLKITDPDGNSGLITISVGQSTWFIDKYFGGLCMMENKFGWIFIVPEEYKYGITVKSSKPSIIKVTEVSKDRVLFDFVSPGKAKLTFTDIYGREEYNWLIVKERITKTKITVDGAEAYTGKPIKKKPVVKYQGKTLKEGRDYTVSYENNTDIGVATMTIDGMGYYTGTVTQTFKIVPKGTSIKKATATKSKMIVKWKKQSKQTTGYQIQYGRKAGFADGKVVTVKSNQTTTRSISGTTFAKKGYYVRIRTYKKVGNKTWYSKWSKPLKVR